MVVYKGGFSLVVKREVGGGTLSIQGGFGANHKT
jgi:hypothetical protein